MKRAWNALKKNNHIKFTIDLYKMGICIISSTQINKKDFNLFF